MAAERGPTLITSVQRALRLMDAVSQHEGGAPAKQLARETGLPLPTTYHLLRTLVREGYVAKLETGAFVLGDAVEALCGRGRGQALRRRVRPVMQELRDELSAASYLTFYEDGEIRVVEIVDTPRTPRVDMWVDFAEAAHATALGKSVLAQLDEQSRRDFLSRHPLVDLTPRTITHSGELLRRLASSGRVMLDQEEYLLGTVCAAVPVSDGTRVGSLGISLRPGRLRRILAADRHLVTAADQVTRTFSLSM
ncbi:IclR family transcriptional regulator C-terminal domain-containing protein [Actinopolymorpha sp. B17G11]|uniref:IclR family transcriptional regulator n=1 Tax=Actinopolymorpha sp. B17G11 TaxID=3160861 RepID=UPI0032E471DA